MSWSINQSLNSLKGQITNFASEILNDGAAEDTTDGLSSTASEVKNLEEKCHTQELEIAALKKLTDELQTTLQSERLARKNGVKEEETNWYWDPPSQASRPTNDEIVAYKAQIQDLQTELSILKNREYDHPKGDNEEEINRLREENLNLTNSLEDLDNQHQMAMERLLALKKELQKNFEFLKQDHEDLKNANDEYSDEIKHLLRKLGETEQALESIKSSHLDYDTLYHKYQNLERVHSLLRENAEKFQEENQELHEEVFKLQEQVTKLEHDVEIVGKPPVNMIPKEKYEDLVNELNLFKRRRDSNQIHLDEINIDDNAKSVIETLKRDISTLKHRLAHYEAENEDNDSKSIKSDKIVQLYNSYVNFDLPVDNVGEMPTSTDNVVMFKLETIFKTVKFYKQEIDDLRQKISEIKSNNNHLQTQIDELTSENEYLTSDVQHLESDLEEMKKNNDFLISEIATLKNSSKLEPIIETHEDNIVKLETELADCTEINKSFESEIKRIEEELAIVKNEKNNLQDSLSDLKNKYKSMLSQLEMCTSESIALQELESDVNLVKDTKLQRTTDEFDDLKRRLTAANAEKEKLAIDINIVQNDKVLLSREINELKSALEASSNSQKTLENMKIILDHELHKLEEQLDDVLKKKEDLEKENIKLNAIFKSQQMNLSNPNEWSAAGKHIEEINLVSGVNFSLQEKCDLLSEELAKLKQEKDHLNNDYNLVKQQLLSAVENSPKLEQLTVDLNLKSDQLDKLSKEISLMKEEKNSIMEEQYKFDEQYTLKNNMIFNLENELKKHVKDLKNKESEIVKLNTYLSESKQEISNLSKTVFDLEKDVKIKNDDIGMLQDKIIKVTEKLRDTSFTADEMREELKKLYVDNEKNRKQAETLNGDLIEKNNFISQLSFNFQELERGNNLYGTDIEKKDEEIKRLNETILKLTNKIQSSNNNPLNDTCEKLSEEKHALETSLNDTRQELQLKEEDLINSRNKLDILENSCKELKQALDNATSEKTELIILVNLKHNESTQYHNEIQRLNHILLEQSNKFKKIMEEKEQSVENTENCPTCESLRNSLKEKDEVIVALNQNMTEYELLRSELNNSSEIVKNLTRRCEDLDKALTVQLDNVKKLTAENLQLSEKEQNSSRELERLRRHLMETEDNYTQELMTSEQKLNESLSRLQQVEDRAKQTSSVYTSNSIRANLEVETLRNQIKLLEKQREEVQSRLSDAEDARSRSEAALTNLQIVLEQFQLDKERDINAATEKIRRKLEEEKQNSVGLKQDMASLNIKLEESIAGLQAATRLGDQVETKSAQINDLKEQVRTLQISVAGAEERYHNAISNQQDKVDKNLVKNLVVNYVISGQNNLNKTQVLRVLSTVLDFNQQECEKLGLIKPAGGESLAAEFVRFLQDESKPRPTIAPPALMRLQKAPSDSSRKTSTSSQPVFEVGHSRNPSTGSHNLLFQNMDVETASQRSGESEPRAVPIGALETGINQTRNNEGAILKNVLKDL